MAKKVVRLKSAEAIDRLDAMIELIYRDVQFGVEMEVALEAANEVATGELSNVKFPGAESYNAIQRSMGLFLALAALDTRPPAEGRPLSKSGRSLPRPLRPQIVACDIVQRLGSMKPTRGRK